MASLCAATLLMVAMTGAEAQTAAVFPQRPVRIVVPFAPGGTSDSLARLLGQKLGETWKQPVIVENKPGADGNLGTDFVARSPPDGHTLLLMDIGTLTMGPVFHAKLPFQPLADLAPVGLIQFSPHALVLSNTMSASHVADLASYAKKNPGRLFFAASNNSARLAGAQFSHVTGIEMTQIPYKGASAAMTAVITGETNIAFNGLFVALPHIRSGKVKAVAVASERRMAAAPEIPTLKELGVPGFVAGSWQGLLAPAGTPRAVLHGINEALVRTLTSPEVRERLASQGAEVIASTPDQFAALLRQQAAANLKIARDANIQPE